MNKLTLIAIATAAFLAGDAIAVRRGNNIIRNNEEAFDKEADHIALKYFRTGMETALTDPTMVKMAHSQLFPKPPAHTDN